MNELKPIRRQCVRATAVACKPVVLALFALLGSSFLVAQDSQTFRSELRAISANAEEDWGAASERLQALLTAHNDADYVRHARPEIVDLHRRLSFESSYAKPGFDDLISGELVSYKPKTGKIKLIYTRGTMADFEDPNKPKPVVKRKRKARSGDVPVFEMPERPRFGPEYRPRIHPALFKSCKIEVAGSNYKSTELLTGIHEAGLFRTMAGEPLLDRGFGGSTYVPTLMIRKSGEKSTELFRKTWLPKKKSKKGKSLWPMERGGKYSIVLDVKPTSLHLRINRKSVVRETWRGAVVGRIGITDSVFDSLVITGQVEPAWLHGLQDSHRQAAHDAFAKSYKAEDKLPAWIFTKPSITVDSAAQKKRRYYPGTEQPKNLKLVQGVLTDLSKGRSTRVLFRMAVWKPDAVPAVVKQYLQSYAYLVEGSFKKSADLAKQVVAADPTFASGRAVLGKSLVVLRESEAAAEQFREVVKLQPDENAYCDLAIALMRWAKPLQAREALEEAASRGFVGDRFQMMRRRVDRIVDGPTFGKRFTVETKHYVITSDIDEAVCKSAGKVLEGALAFYCRMLGDVRKKFEEGQRFQVYLFSGEQGYKRYLEGLNLSIPIHTAGVYSPELEQLLIWNLSVRTDMLRTIRHEGFHQYFDMLSADTPVWLNEGLAEYFEVSRFDAGKPSAGVVRPNHVRTLALVRPSARGSLEQFLKITPRQFYGPKASLNYSQSWALVRYLRGGTPSVRAVFDRLVRALAEGKDREEALAEALEGVDMERLTKGYWASVDKLLKKK